MEEKWTICGSFLIQQQGTEEKRSQFRDVKAGQYINYVEVSRNKLFLCNINLTNS